MSASLSSSIAFKMLCDVFEKVVKARSSEKTEILREFIVRCQKEGAKLKEDDPNAVS